MISVEDEKIEGCYLPRSLSFLKRKKIGSLLSERDINVIYLFDILNLLSDFFEFGFCAHDTLADASIVGLGTDCVELSIDFLAKKVERSAYGLSGVKILAETIDVRGESRCLLGDVAAICKKGDFLE